MDLIKDINNTARKNDPVEPTIKETEPKPDTGKSISDYLSDIQQKQEDTSK